jgi:outer membrane protein assembly factor BamB
MPPGRRWTWLVALGLEACQATSGPPPTPPERLAVTAAADAGATRESPAPLRPTDHLRAVARYPDFDGAIGVGRRLVLVGCTSLRVIDPATTKAADVPLSPVPYSRTCIDVRGSHEDRLYVELEGKVHAIDLARGRVQWSFGGGRELLRRAAVAGGSVVVITGAGPTAKIEGLDGKTGKRRWSAAHPLVDSEDPERENSAFALGDAIIERLAASVTGTTALLRARAATTGKVQWETALTLAGGRSPETIGLAAPPDASALLVLGTVARGVDGADGPQVWLLDVDPATGTVRHEAPLALPTPVYTPTPVFAGDALYLLDANGTASVNPADGTVRWTSSTSCGFAMAADGDVLFVGDPDGLVRALDVRTGARLWSYGLATGGGEAMWPAQVQVARVPDPAGSGRTLLAASTADGVVLFDHDAAAFPARRVTVSGTVATDPAHERPAQIRVGDQRVPLAADGSFRAEVEGRGALYVHVSDFFTAPVVDLEDGRPSYVVQVRPKTEARP